jgi:soluble lytic murein transglycosylase-like protein
MPDIDRATAERWSTALADLAEAAEREAERARPARAVGAALRAVALGVAVMLLPLPLARAERARPEDRPVPGPPGWLAGVHAHLERRMPALGDPERQRLARILVLEAERARIDPLLVLAVIHVESSFNPESVSDRAAVGLMQLREPTLRREAERAGMESADPRDPETNVRAGIRYLRRLLDAFPREEVALMAYNAGPNRILGYLRELGSVPERFHEYPQRVNAELRRLRRAHPEVGLATGRLHERAQLAAAEGGSTVLE